MAALSAESEEIAAYMFYKTFCFCQNRISEGSYVVIRPTVIFPKYNTNSNFLYEPFLMTLNAIKLSCFKISKLLQNTSETNLVFGLDFIKVAL